jgi:EGF-like domain
VKSKLTLAQVGSSSGFNGNANIASFSGYPADVCKNGGVCVPMNGNMTCKCPLGYIGEYCEAQFNECSLESNPCNGGTCIDELLDFRCDCLRGFVAFCMIEAIIYFLDV